MGWVRDHVDYAFLATGLDGDRRGEKLGGWAWMCRRVTADDQQLAAVGRALAPPGFDQHTSAARVGKIQQASLTPCVLAGMEQVYVPRFRLSLELSM